jgi:hypothetical protein
MKVEVQTVRTVTIELTADEAKKLAGLLQVVPTVDVFFEELATEIDMQLEDFVHIYEADDEGTFMQKEEV